MQTRPSSPRPPGAPRWVAMVHRPCDGSWTVAAESPYRAPVLYAAGQMAQTLRARGAAAELEVWGPRDGDWQRFTGPVEPPAAVRQEASGPSRLDERMSDRRQQVLLAGLSGAGLYDLTTEDQTAVETLVDRLDEATLRRVAHWLTSAGSAPRPLGSHPS
ncbi:hypothetical protein ACIQ6Y_13615 [Streptomyces sp. NPDC096205]|uniref:hypothetical protein n=1 Tax=Streptomyces sp. NPDC096205 TaxID=3366081 RepID=UPI003803B81D